MEGESIGPSCLALPVPSDRSADAAGALNLQLDAQRGAGEVGRFDGVDLRLVYLQPCPPRPRLALFNPELCSSVWIGAVGRELKTAALGQLAKD